MSDVPDWPEYTVRNEVTYRTKVTGDQFAYTFPADAPNTDERFRKYVEERLAGNCPGCGRPYHPARESQDPPS